MKSSEFRPLASCWQPELKARTSFGAGEDRAWLCPRVEVLFRMHAENETISSHFSDRDSKTEPGSVGTTPSATRKKVEETNDHEGAMSVGRRKAKSGESREKPPFTCSSDSGSDRRVKSVFQKLDAGICRAAHLIHALCVSSLLSDQGTLVTRKPIFRT